MVEDALYHARLSDEADNSRELLGELSRAEVETVKELLTAAAGEEAGYRPGLVQVVQTFGVRANFHPHVHALATREGWTSSGELILLPYADERSTASDRSRIVAMTAPGSQGGIKVSA